MIQTSIFSPIIWHSCAWKYLLYWAPRYTQASSVWIGVHLPNSPHVNIWMSYFTMNNLPAFPCRLNENGRKGLAGGMILLDCSGVAAGIYSLPSFIFLREGADSAVAVVVYADGGLPMQSAQSEQCNHPVILLQLTFNFDLQRTHMFGCFAAVDNRTALTRQKSRVSKASTDQAQWLSPSPTTFMPSASPSLLLPPSHAF